MKKHPVKKVPIILLTVFLALSVFFTACAYVGFDKLITYCSVFVFPTDFSEDHRPFSTYQYDRLNEQEKIAYICILNKIESHPTYIKIPALSRTEFNNVFFAVKNDNPDLLCFSDSCNMIRFLSAGLMEMHYNQDADTCRQMRSQLLSTADEILSQMPALPDAYEKELYLHDTIIQRCVYDEQAVHPYDAYGCLVEGQAVCSGYARAAMLLLKKAGIEAILVSGTGLSNLSGSISHMWNIVWIDDEPYHLDVTWDDPEAEKTQWASHLYFNLTTQAISADHSDFSVSIACTATENNFFRKEGLWFDSYTSAAVDRICERLTENINNGLNFVELEFADSEVFAFAESSLLDSTSSGSDMYKILSYLQKTVGDKIDSSHVNFSKAENKLYMRLQFDFQ